CPSTYISPLLILSTIIRTPRTPFFPTRRSSDLDEASGRIQPGDDEECEQVVHSGPGGDHQEAAPGRLVRVGPLIIGVLGRRLVGREAGDLAVAAQGNGAEAVVGLPPAEAGDAGAEPERVRFHPQPEQA